MKEIVLGTFQGKLLYDGRYGLIIDYFFNSEDNSIFVRFTDAETLRSRDIVICGNCEWMLRRNDYNVDLTCRQIITNFFNQVSQLGVDSERINYNSIAKYIAKILREVKIV